VPIFQDSHKAKTRWHIPGYRHDVIRSPDSPCFIFHLLPNHTPRGSRTTLPPRLTVPPFPPQLYRQLLLTVEKDGVLIRPQHPTGGDDEDDVRTDGTTGVLIKWGAKGKVETWDGEGTPDDEEGVVLGGILGIVRLWDGTSHTRSILIS
jgi:hypothetical protein